MSIDPVSTRPRFTLVRLLSTLLFTMKTTPYSRRWLIHRMPGCFDALNTKDFGATPDAPFECLLTPRYFVFCGVYCVLGLGDGEIAIEQKLEATRLPLLLSLFFDSKIQFFTPADNIEFLLTQVPVSPSSSIPPVPPHPSSLSLDTLLLSSLKKVRAIHF